LWCCYEWSAEPRPQSPQRAGPRKESPPIEKWKLHFGPPLSRNGIGPNYITGISDEFFQEIAAHPLPLLTIASMDGEAYSHLIAG